MTCFLGRGLVTVVCVTVVLAVAADASALDEDEDDDDDDDDDDENEAAKSRSLCTLHRGNIGVAFLNMLYPVPRIPVAASSYHTLLFLLAASAFSRSFQSLFLSHVVVVLSERFCCPSSTALPFSPPPPLPLVPTLPTPSYASLCLFSYIPASPAAVLVLPFPHATLKKCTAVAPHRDHVVAAVVAAAIARSNPRRAVR